MIPVVLGLGANKKLSSTISENEFYHPATTLKKAFSVLKNVLSNSVMSSIYKTKAMYVTDQEDFYNAAVFGYYNGKPEDLLIQLQGIEALFGRNRSKVRRNEYCASFYGRKRAFRENLARFDPKKEFRQVRRLEPNRQNRLS
jgi:7,8-dihydro-6-hydroxymethylpterin-pyrophosphokinase